MWMVVLTGHFSVRYNDCKGELLMVTRTNRVAWLLAVFSAVALVGVVLVSGFLLTLSKPRRLGFVPGTVKLTHSRLDGERAIVITGQYANLLGQIQGIGYDFKGNDIYLDRYVMLFHPLSGLTTHQDWPIVFAEKDLAPGRHEIFYWASERGYLSAGSFTVSPTTSGPSTPTRSDTGVARKVMAKVPNQVVRV
jgi:hypothetical protein